MSAHWGDMGGTDFACPGGGTPALRKKHARLQDHCREYLNGRRATYEVRWQRFNHVAHILKRKFLLDDQTIVYDLGAGHCQFDYFLRNDYQWRGVYVPVDGAIDGTNLQTWQPPKRQPDIYVCMEILEHLERPLELLARLKPKRGLVLTTPNHHVVDVLACDPDHHSIVTTSDLRKRKFNWDAVNMFGRERDTLVAWKVRRA